MRKFRLKKGFITQKMDDKLVIFDGEESTLYTLNPMASIIFNKLKKGMTEDKIADFLSKKYSVVKDEALKDVGALLKDLKSKKIIM